MNKIEHFNQVAIITLTFILAHAAIFEFLYKILEKNIYFISSYLITFICGLCGLWMYYKITSKKIK